MGVRIVQGDCRDVLKTLPDESVHCVVTSPPYWGLRDYGVAGQIGLEPTIGEYVETMVAVFREVRRVLRKDGTLWLNMGDSYANANPGSGGKCVLPGAGAAMREARYHTRDLGGLKPKDLCGVPWRVAFALQADGWYLRQDIIWAKPNPMPESVTDRCTKAHEYIFLLSKSANYFYDAEAIKEPSLRDGDLPGGKHCFHEGNADRNGYRGDGGMKGQVPPTRNRRSVWEIATSPFPEAHFATFPPALVEPCIKAGTSEKGCCAKCGAPWVRDVEKTGGTIGKGWTDHSRDKEIGMAQSPSCSCFGRFEEIDGPEDWISRETGERKKVRVYVPDGEQPPPVPATCLDPFGGAGTTGMVADRLGRNAILIELSPSYAAMAERRIKGDAGLFAAVENRIAAE